MSLDVGTELEFIKSSMNTFRREKERTLLNESEATEEVAMFGRSATKQDLSYVLDVDCLVSPFSPLLAGEWPRALVANLREKVCDLGHLESTGSLWRLIRKDIGVVGTAHVLLQSCEIGETPTYLTPSLALSTDINSGALWAVKTENDNEGGVRKTKPTTAFGIICQFELVQRNSDGVFALNASKSRDSRMHGNKKLLVAAKASSGTGEEGIAVLSETERSASDNAFQWTLAWQITREDTATEGFSFLDNSDLTTDFTA